MIQSRAAKLPTIPDVSSIPDVPVSLRAFLAAVATTLNLLLGRLKNASEDDRLVTFRDLSSDRVREAVGSGGTTIVQQSGGSSGPTSTATDPDLALDSTEPPSLAGVSTGVTPTSIIVSYTQPAYTKAGSSVSNHAYTALYLAEANSDGSSPGFASAKIVAQASGPVIYAAIGAGRKVYVWLRNVSRADTPGPVYGGAAGVFMETPAAVPLMAEYIEGKIKQAQLDSSIRWASDTILISAANIIADAGFYSPSWWSGGAISAWPSNAAPCGRTGGAPIRVLQVLPGAFDIRSAPISAEPGASYSVRLRIWRSPDFAGTIFAGIHFPGSSVTMPGATTLNSVSWYSMSQSEPGLGAWMTHTATATTSTSYAWFHTIIRSEITAGYCELYLECVRAAGTDMIVDGAVVSRTIAAEAVDADKLAAGAVVAGKIAAGAVTADAVAAGAITAVKIAAGSVTADKLSVGALSAVSTTTGNLTANRIDVTFALDNAWGFVRSLGKWWSDSSSGWILARSGAGDTFFECKGGNSRIWMSNWGDCGISFPKFSVDNNGSASFGGNLSAASGTLGTITAGYLQNSTNTTSLNLNETGSGEVFRLNGVTRIWGDGRVKWQQSLINSSWTTSGFKLATFRREVEIIEGEPDQITVYWDSPVGTYVFDTGIQMASIIGNAYEDHIYCTVSGYSLPAEARDWLVANSLKIAASAVVAQPVPVDGGGFGEANLHVMVTTRVVGAVPGAVINQSTVPGLQMTSIVVNIWK